MEKVRVARLTGGALFYDTPAGRGDTRYQEAMLRTEGEQPALCAF